MVLENEDYIFSIDLTNVSLHVANKQGTGCQTHPCRDAFTKICVVLDSQIKIGYT
nr:hypothetical protein [Candidatus Sigynarchaeota archaeon]